MGNDHNDFQMGRMHGQNGFYSSTSSSEAYRQGMQVGAIERQTKLLKEQERKREEEKRERESKEREALAKEELAREQALDAQWQYENDRHRALVLVWDARRYAAPQHGESSRAERDALFFVGERMREYASDDCDLVRQVREAYAALSKFVGPAPTLPVDVAALAQWLTRFRGEVASIGLIVPFDSQYDKSSTQLRITEPSFAADKIPSWVTRKDSAQVRHGLASFEDHRNALSSLWEGLVPLARAVDAIGLWNIEPKYLGWTTMGPDGPNGLDATECVHLVYSHRLMLQEICGVEDWSAWVDRWLIEPNKQLADQLQEVEHGLLATERWARSDAPLWFDPQDVKIPGGYVGAMEATRMLSAALSVIRSRQQLLHGTKIVEALGGDVTPSLQWETMSSAKRTANRSRPSPEFFDDCLLSETGTNLLLMVKRKSARLVCALIGPFFYISLPELLVGALTGVIVGCVLFAHGFEISGFFLFAFSLLAVWIGFGTVDTPQRYVNRARLAFKNSPTLSGEQRWVLWRSICGIEKPGAVPNDTPLAGAIRHRTVVVGGESKPQANRRRIRWPFVCALAALAVGAGWVALRLEGHLREREKVELPTQPPVYTFEPVAQPQHAQSQSNQVQPSLPGTEREDPQTAPPNDASPILPQESSELNPTAGALSNDAGAGESQHPQTGANDESSATPPGSNQASVAAQATVAAPPPLLLDKEAEFKDAKGYGYAVVRTAPTNNADVLAKVGPGDVFYTEPQSGDWWQVKTQNGERGYMEAESIQLR